MQLPNVYIFNPTCDMAVINGSVSYMPPARLRTFEQELAPVALWLATPNDYVVTPVAPDKAFTEKLTSLGISLPRFITPADLEKSNAPINELRPWGWSPEMHHRLHRLKPLCGDGFKASPLYNWDKGHTTFFSRHTNQRLIEALLPLTANHPALRIPHLPLAANNLADVRKFIDAFGGRAVVKTPWSSSGRGIAMVDLERHRLPDERWIAAAIDRQKQVLVEPLLNKVHDLSFHFWLLPNGELDYLGHNFFMTDTGGKFEGCHIDAFPATAVQNGGTDLKAAIEQAPAVLKQALAQLELHRHYHGPVGIDALWYLDDHGTARLHPAIETNLRYTMGLVNINIRRQLPPGTTGTWAISQQTGHAAHIANNHMLPIVPPSQTFGAWAQIDK